MRNLVFLALTTALLGAPALALAADRNEVKAEAPAPGKDKKAKADDEKVCETVTEVGSIIPKRVCRTRAQIAADREAVERMNADRQAYGGREPGR
ncbi:MAG TPA: hypothetical protein VFN88_04485 [Caulobacteraceae bacterium]|nr:hypothetical protein [Caulobacteraceae bacterium]